MTYICISLCSCVVFEEIQMRYTHIIWDFNGTLFDDVDACIASVNTMLSERGLATIDSGDDYRKIFKFPIIEYYRSLGFDFEKEPYEVLAPIWVELYNKFSLGSGLARDAKNALEYFKNIGLPQVIISATEKNMLKSQLNTLGIDGYFESVMGREDIHAHSKKELAIAWKEEHKDSNPLVIGDTEHDAEMANAIGADCFLVCNGHQQRETLEKCEGCVICVDLFHAGMAFEIRNFRKDV